MESKLRDQESELQKLQTQLSNLEDNNIVFKVKINNIFSLLNFRFYQKKIKN